MWLEMSRDPAHGGKDWAFTECLWSPTHKKPQGTWPYWELLRQVKKDDVVVHLRGIGRRAAFVGYSTADGVGYVTSRRPPQPGKWSYAKSFYRVPLTGFVGFNEPLLLRAVFAKRQYDLRIYYERNQQALRPLRQRLFFVIQSGRLQCLNGAYLSHLSNDLASLIFDTNFEEQSGERAQVQLNIGTGERLMQLKMRIGQDKFSQQVRGNYQHRCCFPGCPVNEDGLLVGAHIARWADAEDLRGNTSNGLCLCLFHDRAFELGFFTLTTDHRVAVNKSKSNLSPWSKAHVLPFEGNQIRLGKIKPALECIHKHWERIGFFPD